MARKPRVLFLRPPGSRLPVPDGRIVVANIPVIDVVPVEGAAGRVLEEAEKCGWLVITSPRAPAMLRPVVRGLQRLQVEGRLVVAAVGPKTRVALEEAGLRVDVVPAEYRGKALGEELARMEPRPRCVVLARSDTALPDLPETLRSHGIRVVEVPIYRVEVLEDMARAAASIADVFDYVVFTSPSIAEAFTKAYRGLGRDPSRPGFRPAAIGPSTARRLRRLGYPEPLQPKEYTMEALIEELLSDYGRG